MNMHLGIISRRDAEWIGMSASVAGGWVMVPAEWWNVSRLPDALGLGTDHLLALLPTHITSVPMRPADPVAVAQILREDIQRNADRTWSRQSRADDCAELQAWLDRIAPLTP